MAFRRVHEPPPKVVARLQGAIDRKAGRDRASKAPGNVSSLPKRTKQQLDQLRERQHQNALHALMWHDSGQVRPAADRTGLTSQQNTSTELRVGLVVGCGQFSLGCHERRFTRSLHVTGLTNHDWAEGRKGDLRHRVLCLLRINFEQSLAIFGI